MSDLGHLLFSPLDAPDADACPIELKHLNVVRLTETDIDHRELARIADAWSEHPSDAVVLRDPDTGSQVTWVGATYFRRVMPKPSRGKIYVGEELFRYRRNTLRHGNVTPHAWWLMNAGEKLDAMRSWKKLSQAIREVKSKRIILMFPLGNMLEVLIDGWVLSNYIARTRGNMVSGGASGASQASQASKSTCEMCADGLTSECMFCDDIDRLIGSKQT